MREPSIPPAIVLEHAIEVAQSNLDYEGGCCKSHRAVVIFGWSRSDDATETVEVFSASMNGPPMPFFCERSDRCRENCAKVCVHAEEAALLMTDPVRTHGAELLHAKVVDGRIVASGPPSCWQCSRSILLRAIAGVWLFHDDGWKRYTALEFHTLTLEHHNLPTTREDSIMQKPTGLRVEFYRDAIGKYRWTQYAENGVIRDASSESFHDMQEAQTNWNERIVEARSIKQAGAIYVRETNGDRVKTSLRST